MSSLFAVVPKSLMPSDYGGSAGSCAEITRYWEKKVLSYRDYFIEDAAYGVDETRRVVVPKNLESQFGSEGTFKKLED